MSKTLTFDMENFKAGLWLLDDDTNTPPGSARQMTNVLITDRGGIAPRPGTTMLGAVNANTEPCQGFFVFKKSFGEIEIPMKSYDDEMEAYSPSYGWFRLRSGYSVNKEFGFTSSLVNTDNEDFTYFCNRYEPFQRWTGEIAHLASPVVGGATSIIVDSTLYEDVYDTKVATANSATTLDIAAVQWANSQWINFYVYITSGVHSGKIRKITANTGSQITFDTLGSAPGNCSFEIRRARFDLNITSTFIYNGTTITVTGIDTETALTVGSAHAAPAGTPITQQPVDYYDSPRGNRIDSLLGRTMVGNVRSAMSRGAGGALQGSSAAGSIFVSRINDPKDFSFAAARAAGEGDIISTPYGGGDITDIAVQEDVAYVYKKSYIEAVKYSNDADDIAIRVPLKPGVGSVGRVIKGKDDHYFITIDKQFTSLGRVLAKDQTPQTENIGLPIKRLLETYTFDTMVGKEFKNRVLFSAKSEAAAEGNDSTLVWNKTTRSFEGAWTIGASSFDIYRDELYYAESRGPNVWKMFDGKAADDSGTTQLPVTAAWQSNFFNLLPVQGNIQAMQSLAFEGYIAAGTTFTVRLYKEFSSTASVEFTFGGLNDDTFLLDDDLTTFLGANPLGLNPIGTIDAPGADGRRRFSFMVYFPFVYGQYFSLGFQSSGVDQDWEIVRASLGVKESISTNRSGIKQI